MTNTEISSRRLYCENTLGCFEVTGATIPPPSASSRELYPTLRSEAEHAYAKHIYFTELDKGNHHVEA